MAFGGVVRSASSPSTVPLGIGGNANVIWHDDNNTDDVYELSTADFSTVRSANTPSTLPTGIGGDTTTIWHSDAGTDLIYELDTADFSVVRSASAPNTDPYGIGGDSSVIWHAYNPIGGSPTVYELDPADFSVARSASSPGADPGDIGGDANVIWHSDFAADDVYELDVADFSVVQQADSPSTLPRGIGGSADVIWSSDLTPDLIYELDTGAAPSPVVESFTATYASTNATSITGTKPTGTAAGDLIIAIHGADGNPTLTPESGFTSITGDIAPGACVAEASYKVAGASEPASYTFDCSASETQILYLLRISGADTSSPINIYGTDSSAGAIDLDAPSVTTTVDGTRVIRAAIKNAIHNDTLGFDDANVTELSLGGTTAGTGNIQGAVAHEEQATAGATGTETYDGGNSSDDIVTFTIAIAPGAGGGGDTAVHRPLMMMGVG